MFAKLTTKIALHKAGISSKAFSIPELDNRSNANQRNSNNDGAGSELLPFANPFANLSVPKSWNSWQTPPPPPVGVAAPLKIGDQAPLANGKLRLQSGNGKPCIVAFLRYCGCPCEFASWRLRSASLLIPRNVKC